MRVRVAVATVLVLCAAIPSEASADRWVTPLGSDAAQCGLFDACATVNRAYALAAPGETVFVAPGVYPRQEIKAQPSKVGPRVVVRPMLPAPVTLEALRVEGSHIEFADMTVGGWAVAQANDVVFRNLQTVGGISIQSASDVQVLGGSVGPGVDYSPQIKAFGTSTVPPQRILIDGVTFHDWTKASEGSHVDCLHVMAADGLTIRNSRFTNCEAFNVLFTKFGSAGSPRNVTLENNFFDCCRSGFFSVQLGGGHGEKWQNFLIRFNSANQSFSVGDNTTTSASNVRFDSNILPSMPSATCSRPGVQSSYNVLATGATCGPTDIVAAQGFMNPTALDFHLAPNAVAVNRGNPASYPSTDIDGEPRGVPPDAGADELTPPAPPPQVARFARASRARVAVLTKRGLRIRLRCGKRAGANCRGRVLVKPARGKRLLGGRRYTVGTGKKKVVTVRLSRGERRRVRRAHRVRMAITASGSRARKFQKVRVRVQHGHRSHRHKPHRRAGRRGQR